ncbi:MAG: hypothetical protein ACWGN7_00905 [Thermodesulfovibrionales bacterium]
MAEKISNKLMYVGAGVGIVLFAVFGLLPGSFLGGVMGLSLAGTIFGTPVEPGVIARIIIAASMLLGVMVSGLIFIVASSVLGWIVGMAIEAVQSARRKEVKQEIH